MFRQMFILLEFFANARRIATAAILLAGTANMMKAKNKRKLMVEISSPLLHAMPLLLRLNFISPSTTTFHPNASFPSSFRPTEILAFVRTADQKFPHFVFGWWPSFNNKCVFSVQCPSLVLPPPFFLVRSRRHRSASLHHCWLPNKSAIQNQTTPKSSSSSSSSSSAAALGLLLNYSHDNAMWMTMELGRMGTRKRRTDGEEFIIIQPDILVMLLMRNFWLFSWSFCASVPAWNLLIRAIFMQIFSNWASPFPFYWCCFAFEQIFNTIRL